MKVCHFAENCHNFLSLTPFGLENIDPRSPKLLTIKFTGVPFSLTKFGDFSSYRSWDSREGQNLPPFPGRVILRPFPVRVLTGIVHWISISTFFQLLRCFFTFLLSTSFLISLFPPSLSHSSRIVDFLSVLLWRHWRPRWFIARAGSWPTPPRSSPRPRPRTAAGGRSATAADPARA